MRLAPETRKDAELPTGIRNLLLHSSRSLHLTPDPTIQEPQHRPSQRDFLVHTGNIIRGYSSVYMVR